MDVDDGLGPLVVPPEAVDAVLSGPLREAVEASDLVVWTVDTRLRLRSSAGGWLRRLGTAGPRPVGRSVDEVWPGRRDVRALIERALAGESLRAEVELVGRRLETTYRPVRVGGPGGPVAGVVGLSRDVTAERAAAERARVLAGLAEREVGAATDLTTELRSIAAAAAGYARTAVVVRLGLGGPDDEVVVAHPDPDVEHRIREHVESTGRVATAGRHRADLAAGRPVPYRGSPRTDPAFAPSARVLADLGYDGVVAWPLVSPAGPLGSLAVMVLDGVRPGLAGDGPAGRDDVEVAFMTDLAARAGLHVEAVRTRLELAAETVRRARRARHLEVLAESSRLAQATGALTPADVDRVARLTAGALDGCVVVFDVTGATARLRALANVDRTVEPLQRTVYAGELEAAYLLRLLGPGRVPVVQHLDGRSIVERRGPQWQEYAAVLDGTTFTWLPLAAHGETLGVLGFQRRAEPDEDELAFLRDLTERLGLAEHNRRLAAERDAAAGALAASEQRFRSAFGEAPVAILLVGLRGDALGRVLDANVAAGTLLGRPVAGLVGADLSSLVHRDDAAVDGARLREMAAGRRVHAQREERFLRAGGEPVDVRTSASAVGPDGAPEYAVLHVEDVTERKQAAEELARRALHDPVTGLPNRHVALDHLGHALTALHRRPGRVAVLYLDLDGFKAVNDTLGHEAGDRVLVEVASRLTRTVRAGDTAARLGGDEFVVVCEDVGTDAEVERLADRVVAALGAPVFLDAGTAHVGASVGVAVADAPGTAPEQLLRDADTAMYEAKRRGRHRFELFRPTLGREASRRLRMHHDVRDAVEHDRLRLHYQPVVDLTDGSVVGAEALLRVDDPVQGLLLPADFIDVVEQSQLVHPVGAWVLDEACRRLRDWQDDAQGRPATAGTGEGADTLAVTLAVNVSTRQAMETSMSRLVLGAAERAGADPAGLCLEITERTLLDADDAVVADLEALTRHGVRLAIDDFGTGYSSLSDLQRLPVDTLKVDRSFVAGLGTDERASVIVAGVVALGRALGLVVVAEGVETPEQARVLRGLGCPRAQGYLFGRPGPAELVGAALRDAPLRGSSTAPATSS